MSTLKVNTMNQGLGNNFIDGAFFGRGKYYRVCVGDCPEPKEDLLRLLNKLGEADILVPNPKMSNRSLSRRILSRLYTIILEEEEVNVAKLIITELESDNIQFTEPNLHEMYNEIVALLKEKELIDLQYFINHPNKLINKITVDLISLKHNISANWAERHRIYTGREDEKMRITTEKAILSLKNGHLNKQIASLQKKIKDGSIDSKGMKLLNQLTKIKTKIAKSIGRNMG